MDLEAVLRSMQLDALTVRVSQTLTRASVGHVILKGPTTARWLYDPPRTYRDVDVLVQPSKIADAVRALCTDTIGAIPEGRLGEHSRHSLTLITQAGTEIDLHITLPMLQPAKDDRIWWVMSPHAVPFVLEGREVPALDVIGRLLVVVLHAAGSSREAWQPNEDLRRALAICTDEEIVRAAMLSEHVGCKSIFDALVLGVGTGTLEMRLRRSGAVGARVALAQIKELEVCAIFPAVLAEIFPSRSQIMKDAQAGSGIVRAWLRRNRRLIRELRGRP